VFVPYLMSEQDPNTDSETVAVPKETLTEIHRKLSQPRRVLRINSEHGNTWEDQRRAEKAANRVKDVRETLKALQDT